MIAVNFWSEYVWISNLNLNSGQVGNTEKMLRKPRKRKSVNLTLFFKYGEDRTKAFV